MLTVFPSSSPSCSASEVVGRWRWHASTRPGQRPPGPHCRPGGPALWNNHIALRRTYRLLRSRLVFDPIGPPIVLPFLPAAQRQPKSPAGDPRVRAEDPTWRSVGRRHLVQRPTCQVPWRLLCRITCRLREALRPKSGGCASPSYGRPRARGPTLSIFLQDAGRCLAASFRHEERPREPGSRGGEFVLRCARLSMLVLPDPLCSPAPPTTYSMGRSRVSAPHLFECCLNLCRAHQKPITWTESCSACLEPT